MNTCGCCVVRFRFEDNFIFTYTEGWLSWYWTGMLECSKYSGGGICTIFQIRPLTFACVPSPLLRLSYAEHCRVRLCVINTSTQLDVTCFIISLFNAQHVSDVNTSILKSLRLICWVISWAVLLWFMHIDVTLWFGWGGVVSVCRLQNQNNTTHDITQQISRKLLRMDVLTSEICWSLNNEIKKQVTSSWSLFIECIRRFYSIVAI